MLNLCEGILHKVVLHCWVDVIPYDFNIFVPVCARLLMPKSCKDQTQWSQKVSKNTKKYQKVPKDRINEIVPELIVLIYGKTLGDNSRKIRQKT